MTTDHNDDRTPKQKWRDEAYLKACLYGGEVSDYLDETDHPTNGKYVYAQGEERIGDVEDEYVYRDANKRPWQRVERTSAKKFPVAAWDGQKWKYGAPKGPKLPFNLPELIAADPETPVFICEGEKDALNVEHIGLVSTTNSGGAGKWSADLNPYFKGRTVFILADKDAPGRAHANKVAGHLRIWAKEVRIVELPGDGKDVSDWIEFRWQSGGVVKAQPRSAIVRWQRRRAH